MVDGVVSVRSEGTPQGGPISPLLSNILLTDLDRELEKRGHKFCRYADDCHIYVRSQAAGQRVMDSVTKFLEKRLRLKVNRAKSAVDRPWRRKFLGYTMNSLRKPRLKPAPASLKRLKEKLRVLFRCGRGWSVGKTAANLKPLVRGWVGYFRLSEEKTAFKETDKWLRHRMRAVIWRHWKRPKTRAKELQRRGLSAEQASKGAYNGKGPWWNAQASHMNFAVPNKMLRQFGFPSFLEEFHRLKSTS
jgi:RNA-directed DNA polymerase